ncbi:hypothetical protein VaNZ11_012402 [Volvox africanus]|uniref:Uncharacterized protein n=1 Tax=Volvox africanus TaxID=51714 RepID=A0ABQ5SDR8_9CHLO|nr:hypothetical protein VaNZ11_012402 [Volvox africanus]
MITKPAVQPNENNTDKRTSLDASSTPLEPPQASSGRWSVQAAEAAIIAAVQRRFSRIGAAQWPQSPDHRATTVITSPLSPRLSAAANPERCGDPASPSRSVLTAGGVPDLNASMGRTSQAQEPCGNRKPGAAAAELPVDMSKGGGCSAATTIVAASTNPPPLYGNSEILPNAASSAPFCESVSIFITPTGAQADDYVPKTANDTDAATGFSLGTPVPAPGLKPPPGPDPVLLPGIHLSCGPELQTADFAGLMTTAAACAQASWSALSGSSSAGEATLDCLWTGDCSAAAHVISALPPQRRRRLHHQQREDDSHMGSFGVHHGGGGGQEAAGRGSEDAASDSPKRYGPNGGAGPLGTYSIGTCCPAAVGRYGTLMISSAGWRCTELYDMHDSLLLSRLSARRVVAGGLVGGAGGGGDDGNLAGIGTSTRMGLSWAVDSAFTKGDSKPQDGDLQAVGVPAGEQSAVGKEEAEDEAEEEAAAAAGRSPGPSSGMAGKSQVLISHLNRRPYEVTPTVSRTDQNSRTDPTSCHPADAVQARCGPFGGLPSAPRVQAQRPGPASTPLPQLLQLHLPAQTHVQHRLAAANFYYSGGGSCGGGGGGHGGGAAPMGGWGAALEAMLEGVAPRADYYSPPVAPLAPAANGWRTPGANSAARSAAGSIRPSNAGAMVERSGRGTMMASMRRLAGQIKSRVSSTDVSGIMEVAPSDRSSHLSIHSGGASATANPGGAGSAGTMYHRGLLCSTSSLSHQPANGATLSLDVNAASVQSDAVFGAELAFQKSLGVALPRAPCKLGSGHSLTQGSMGCSPDSCQGTTLCASAASAAGRAATAPATPMPVGTFGADYWQEGMRSKVSYTLDAFGEREARASPEEGPAAGRAGAAAATETDFNVGYVGGEPITAVTTLSVRQADDVDDGCVGGSHAAQCRTTFYRNSSYTSRGGAAKDDETPVAVVRGASKSAKSHQVPLPCKQPSASEVKGSGNSEQGDAGGCGGRVFYRLICLLGAPKKRLFKSSRARRSRSTTHGLSSWSGSVRGSGGGGGGGGGTLATRLPTSDIVEEASRRDRLARIAPLAAAVFSP